MAKTRKSTEGVTFAFLDLDNTLIDTNASRLNTALLDALKDAGIKDLCIFSSMNDRQIHHDLDKPDTILTRPEIIRILEKEYGFNVHKVITPADIFQDTDMRYPGSYYENNWKPTYDQAEKAVKKATTPGERVKAIIEVIDESNPDANMKAHGDKIDSEYTRLMTEGKTKEAQEWQKANRDSKAEMFALALDNIATIPKKGSKHSIGAIVYFEDKPNEIAHVAHVNKSRGTPLLLTCIEAKPNIAGKQIGDVSEKADKTEVYTRYHAALNQHMNKFAYDAKETIISISDLARNQKIEGYAVTQKEIEEEEKKLAAKTTPTTSPTLPKRSSIQPPQEAPPLPSKRPSALPPDEAPPIPPKRPSALPPQEAPPAPPGRVTAPARPRSVLPPDPKSASKAAASVEKEEKAAIVNRIRAAGVQVMFPAPKDKEGTKKKEEKDTPDLRNSGPSPRSKD